MHRISQSILSMDTDAEIVQRATDIHFGIQLIKTCPAPRRQINHEFRIIKEAIDADNSEKRYFPIGTQQVRLG